MGYTEKADYWASPEGLLLIKAWSRDGYSLGDIEQKIGVSPNTFIKWRKNYPDIEEALREGKELVDYKVENALLKRALGYKITEVKQIMNINKRSGKLTVDKVEKTEKEVLPDPTSIAIWLNNRKPDQWKRNRDNFMSLDDDHNNITVNIIKRGKEESLIEEEKQSAEQLEHNDSIKEQKDIKEKEAEWDEVIEEYGDE